MISSVPTAGSRAFKLAALLPLVFALLSFDTFSSSVQDKDTEIRAAYENVAKLRAAMNGEMTDEQRRDKMINYENAARAFIEKYKGTPGIVQGHFDLGRAYLEVFNPEDAAKEFEAYLKAAPKGADADKAMLFLGDSYRATMQLDKAEAVYRRFESAFPKHKDLAYAKLGLATTKVLSLDFTEAEVIYQDILAHFAEHRVAPDASMQLLTTYLRDFKYDEARDLLKTLESSAKDAPELLYIGKQLEILGKPAPELVGVQAWAGPPGSSIERMRGRVLVLCFFMVKNIPSARTLQWLSKMERDLDAEGVTVWGLSKAYKSSKGVRTLDWETRWLQRYRENPEFVIRQELSLTDTVIQQQKELFDSLKKPITVSLGLTKDFTNHRAYKVRRVPCVIVIDKKGRVRLIEEAGQPEGGFVDRLIRKTVKRLAVE